MASLANAFDDGSSLPRLVVAVAVLLVGVTLSSFGVLGVLDGRMEPAHRLAVAGLVAPATLLGAFALVPADRPLTRMALGGFVVAVVSALAFAVGAGDVTVLGYALGTTLVAVAFFLAATTALKTDNSHDRLVDVVLPSDDTPDVSWRRSPTQSVSPTDGGEAEESLSFPTDRERRER